VSFFIGEKIVSETSSEIKLAVLEANVSNLDKKVTAIQADVKAIIDTLSKQQGIETEILTLKAEILSLKNSSNLWKWLAPTLTAVFTAAVTFLLISYLSHT
jgi:hypothetical protein